MLAGGTGILDSSFSVSATWDRVRRYQASGIALAGRHVEHAVEPAARPRDREIPLRFISAAPVPTGELRGHGGPMAVPHRHLLRHERGLPADGGRRRRDQPRRGVGSAQPQFRRAASSTPRIEPVPVGEVGEIVCRPRRSHVMFEGYDGRDRETVEQFRNLWFHTGDMGRFDDDGYLYFADRKKDAMRRRGREHLVVRGGAGAPPPSCRGRGGRGRACPASSARTRSWSTSWPVADETIDMEAFMDFCCEHLPYFAVPRYVEVTPELPKNAVGRILKHELRARGVPHRPGTVRRRATPSADEPTTRPRATTSHRPRP